jgi:hypothetical protein
MKMILLLLTVFMSLVLVSNANATCDCVCKDGQVQAVCSSKLDIKPTCPPRVCPKAQPSIKPSQPPKVQPVGKKKCIHKQIYNDLTHKYESRELCY